MGGTCRSTTVAEAGERSRSTARHLGTVAADFFQLKTRRLDLWVETADRR
jgi:hypothetical protein